MGRSEIRLWVLIRRYDLLEPENTNVEESLQQVTLSTGLTFDELKNLVYSWANVDECNTRVLKIRRYDHNLVPLSSLLHGSTQERPFIIDIVSVHQFCPAEKRTLPIGYIEALKSKLNYLKKRVQIAESEVQNVATIHYNAVEDSATQLVNCVRFLDKRLDEVAPVQWKNQVTEPC